MYYTILHTLAVLDSEFFTKSKRFFMNKAIRSLSFLLLLSLCVNSTFAQETWVWDTYKIAMDLPEDFKVLVNSDNEFEAEGDGMEIFMFVFEEDISLREMKNATVEAAIEMELEEVDAVQNIKTRGYEGKYVAGYLDGSAVLLCGLINPDNITNFFVAITFNDDDGVAEEAAFEILDSIRKSR